MVKEKVWVAVNISLGFIILLLLGNFLDLTVPAVGLVIGPVEGVAECAIEWDGEVNKWNDLDRCCLESRKQLGCYTISGEYQKKCVTGSSASYLLTEAAYDYCKKQRFW